jgi:hypothetical protein
MNHHKRHLQKQSNNLTLTLTDSCWGESYQNVLQYYNFIADLSEINFRFHTTHCTTADFVGRRVWIYHLQKASNSLTLTNSCWGNRIKMFYSITILLPTPPRSTLDSTPPISNVFGWFCRKKEIEDTKGVIRIRKSKRYNTMAKTEKDKRTNNDLQNIRHKTKHRVTRIPLKTEGELRCFYIVYVVFY